MDAFGWSTAMRFQLAYMLPSPSLTSVNFFFVNCLVFLLNLMVSVIDKFFLLSLIREREKSNNVKIFNEDDSYVGAGPWWLYGGCTHALDRCWLKHVELFLKKEKRRAIISFFFLPSSVHHGEGATRRSPTIINPIRAFFFN